MAKAKTNSLLQNISGKVDSEDKSTFRYRFGQQEVYKLSEKKRAPMTTNQERSATAFSKINKIASVINKNDQLKQPFLAHYNSLPADKRPQILFRSIIADLSADSELLSQYEYLLN